MGRGCRRRRVSWRRQPITARSLFAVGAPSRSALVQVPWVGATGVVRDSNADYLWLGFGFCCLILEASRTCGRVTFVMLLKRNE